MEGIAEELDGVFVRISFRHTCYSRHSHITSVLLELIRVCMSRLIYSMTHLFVRELVDVDKITDEVLV